MRKDLRESPEYAAVAEHVRRLHEPAFGSPHHVTDLVTTADAGRIVVTGSVYDELDGLPRTALYEVRDGTLHALTSGSGSAKAAGFAPDGSALAFLSDRAKADVFQLYLLTDGQLGEARPAPAVPGTAEYLAWSPDGTRILLGVAGLGAEMADAQGSGTAGSKRVRAAVVVPAGRGRRARGRVAQPVALHPGLRRPRQDLTRRAERLGGGLVRSRTCAGHHQRPAQRGRLVLLGAQPAAASRPVR